MPEVKMGKVDDLNRRLDLKVEIENNNENQKFIREEWIRGMVEVVVEGPETMLVEKIKRVREKNKKVVRVVEEMKKIGVRAFKGDEWEIEGDLVLKKKKCMYQKMRS